MQKLSSRTGTNRVPGLAVMLLVCVAVGSTPARAQPVAVEVDAGPPREADAPEAVSSEPLQDPPIVAPGPPPDVTSTGAATLGTPPAASAPVNEPRPAAAVEVTVRAAPSAKQRHAQSAEAVSVLEMKRAQREAGDMGAVLARAAGVTVQRAGGLGSEMRFALNGLSNDQVRFFIDGLPLDLTFFPYGIASFPVNLTDSVEVYKGVVPVRFASDALGGAVNLVLPDRHHNHARASYELGSFGLQRGTIGGGYRHERSGFVINGLAYADRADNDYRVDVLAADERGRLRPATVKRFHDGFRQYGASAEVGVVDRPWAEKLLLRGYYSTYDKELQNNPTMDVPYGEVEYGEYAAGGSLRYDVALSEALHLSAVAAYGRRRIDFYDQSLWVYDWYGKQVYERRLPGEIKPGGSDESQWQNAGLGRVVLAYKLHPAHQLTLAGAPTFTSRRGTDRTVPDGERDPLAARSELLVVVSGVEYEANLFALPDAPASSAERDKDLDYRLQNVLFAKSYLYRSSSEADIPGDVSRREEMSAENFGIGDAVRLRFTRELLGKLSYEYTTRLPRPDEAFGNGVLIGANPDLKPELSHNLNLGPRLELKRLALGELTSELSGFLRHTDQQIMLVLTDDISQTYQNVLRARTLGLEWSAYWSAPRRLVMIDGMLTYLDQRNLSTSGPFKNDYGDRLPNRPWLTASWGARLHFDSIAVRRDELEPFYTGRYSHWFYRTWEGQGDAASKQTIPTQTTHGIGLSWIVKLSGAARVTTTAEVQNLTDAKVFDFFGVQRPGRAFYLKVSGSL